MAKLTRKEIAQRFALQGNTEAALAELFALRSSGDVGASASLAEIAAYKGKWKEVLQYVEVVFGTPSSLYTQNVYQDMTMLVARAGTELSEWAEVRRLAKFALSKLTKRDEAKVATIRELANFAQRTGKGRYVAEDECEERRKANFEAALDKLSKSKEKRFKIPDERRNHLFALARACDYYPGAVAMYDQEKALPFIFDNVVFAASGLARDGRTEEAWRAIRSTLHLWWPVEVTQIAPIVFLTDEAIKVLMTPERCEEILRAPRGPGAQAK